MGPFGHRHTVTPLEQHLGGILPLLWVARQPEEGLPHDVVASVSEVRDIVWCQPFGFYWRENLDLDFAWKHKRSL